MHKLCTSAKIPNRSPLGKRTRHTSLDKIRVRAFFLSQVSLPRLGQWPKDQSHLKKSLLQAASLPNPEGCYTPAQFLHSSSGFTINSKTSYKNQPLFSSPKPSTYPFPQSPFLYSNSSSSTSALGMSFLPVCWRKVAFFGRSHVNTLNHSHLTKSHHGLMTSTVTSQGDNTEPWQQMADSHTLTFSHSTLIRSRLAYEL